MNLICRMNGSTVTNFTDGKVYRADKDMGTLYRVIDDLGRARFVIPGAKCPHLVRVTPDRRMPGGETQECVGTFERLDVKSVHFGRKSAKHLLGFDPGGGPTYCLAVEIVKEEKADGWEGITFFYGSREYTATCDVRYEASGGFFLTPREKYES